MNASTTPVLLDLGPDAYSHQAEVDEVKRQVGIDHNYFDCWIYGFLENKNFQIDETVAKLQRREDFERTQLGNEEFTDWMFDNMRKGIIQVIGNDKAGRVTLYICTARDHPLTARRDESRQNFDMFLSYGTRLRKESKRCQIAMLINQEGASMRTNLDMTFEADIALRIAKFYPGCVDKMYVCKMGRLLSALAKPIFSRLPAIVSDRIIIISDGDIAKGKLLDLYDEDVLPIALGGKNDCDKQENYDRFACTIRDYFRNMKAAIHRGLSVKEWELENLRAEGAIPDVVGVEALRRSMLNRSITSSLSNSMHQVMGSGGGYLTPGYAQRSWSAASAGAQPVQRALLKDNGEDSDDNLVTCDTISVELAPVEDHLRTAKRAESTMLTVGRDLVADYMDQFETLEAFFRISLTELYEREWLMMLQREVKERREIQAAEEQFHGDRLIQSLPPTLHLIVKAFLWIALMVMSCYFLIGTLFIGILGVVTLTYIFFSMFAHPYYIFPYGAAFVVTGAQFCIFCSRGFDLTRNTYNGRLIQALKAFGAKTLAFQVVIYVVGTLAYFVLFCVMAARYDVLTGIQFSIAYGWIVAVCLTLIYHFFFAFGFKEITKKSYATGSRENNAELTLYLFMDVDVDDDRVNRRSSVEVLLIALIAALALAAGVCYITGAGVFFLCAAVVMLCALLMVCSSFLSINNASSSSMLGLCGVFYVCLFWADAVFTMSAYGWQGDWGNSLLAVLLVMLFSVLMCFLTAFDSWKGAVRRWLFRVTWILLMAHLIGCVVVLLVYNYKMGLFTLALGIHLLISGFRTNEASNNYGRFLLIGGFTASILVCCLIASNGTSELYSGVVSDTLLPDYAYRDGGRNYSANTFTPLCLERFSNGSIDLVGMALFAKLGFNTNGAAQLTDLKRWFPSFEEAVPVSSGPLDVMEVSAFRDFTSPENTTVITVRNGVNLHVAIEAMTMWVDAYCISFFSFLMPTQYLYDLMPYLSFAQAMSPLLWKNSVDATAHRLDEYLNNFTNPTDRVYVVGHGPAGAIAAISALKSSSYVQTILFSSPPVIPSKYKLRSSDDQLAREIVAVHTASSVVDTWYPRTAYRYTIPCDGGGKICDRLDTTVLKLNELCTALPEQQRDTTDNVEESLEDSAL